MWSYENLCLEHLKQIQSQYNKKQVNLSFLSLFLKIQTMGKTMV